MVLELDIDPYQNSIIVLLFYLSLYKFLLYGLSYCSSKFTDNYCIWSFTTANFSDAIFVSVLMS
jgi:hypothetical protein